LPVVLDLYGPYGFSTEVGPKGGIYLPDGDFPVDIFYAKFLKSLYYCYCYYY
jgi:hypothetical protein